MIRMSSYGRVRMMSKKVQDAVFDAIETPTNASQEHNFFRDNLYDYSLMSYYLLEHQMRKMSRKVQL